MSQRPSIRNTAPPPPSPTTKKYSTASFAILLTAAIIFGIIAIIFIILYFRGNSSKIDPSQCPPKVTGLVVTTNTKITTPATNCGNVSNCTYTVSTLENARGICLGLGSTKCASFSLEQQPLSNNYTMIVSSSTATTPTTGTDTFTTIN